MSTLVMRFFYGRVIVLNYVGDYFIDTLDDLRTSIDNIDNAMVYLLAERFRITAKVGALKQQQSLPLVDKDREATQLARIRQLAAQAGLDPEVAAKILRLIIDETVRRNRARES